MCRAAVMVTFLAAACGRVGFAQLATSDASDAADAPTATDGAAGAIAYVGPFAQQHPGAGASDSFTVQAQHAGDTIVLQVDCSTASAPTGIAVTASGWSFVPLDAIGGEMFTWGASFTATAPDTTATSLTVTWSGTTCDNGKGELGDEFSSAAPGGMLAIDAHAQTGGSGDCTGVVTTARADDAVWGACFTLTSLVAVGSGFTKAADDNGGDWAEYELTAAPAATAEPVTFTNANTSYVLSMVALQAD